MKEFASTILDAEPGKTHLFSVGQAGFVIKSASGQLLGIDLYLSDCVERLEGHMGFKRLLPRLLVLGEVVFDALVATHAHWDHFDVDAMTGLMEEGRTCLFASEGCRPLVERLELDPERTHYVKSGDCAQAGDFTLHFIRCDHGAAAPDAVGVVVEVDGLRICEAGDTSLHLDWKNVYLASGALDAFIAPINGVYGNLSERDCAKLAAALRPQFAIPCHYGMFASHGGNPGKFLEEMKTLAPDCKCLLMAQGERFTFGTGSVMGLETHRKEKES